MIVFKSKIYSNKNKEFLEGSLKQRLLSPTEYPIYIFPLCLFSKEFYHDLKESRKGLYEGQVSDGKIELSRTSKVFSTRTWLPLILEGSIIDNEISIKCVIPNYIPILIFGLILSDLFFNATLNDLDNLLFLVVGFIAILYFIKIINVVFTFRRQVESLTKKNI